MKKIIATTTINPPTDALMKYIKMEDWSIIIAGDLKTPHEDYIKLAKEYSNVTYFSPEDQVKRYERLSDLIGWNCIERRNMAILDALVQGADVIALIDDDNIPYENWAQDLCVDVETTVTKYNVDDVAFDPIGATTEHSNLWHRGFPLERIPYRDYSNKESITMVPKVQAIFWNGDPDVDAICRMIYNPNCNFNPNQFPFTSNKMAPFNSQNTILSKDVVSDYFLFPQTERMQDIWAAYYLQAKGHDVIFTKPGVYSDRTLGTSGRYSIVNDMKKEYLGMENNLQLIQDVTENPDKIKNYISERSWDAFQEWKNIINNL